MVRSYEISLYKFILNEDKMSSSISTTIWEVLMCSYCGSDLKNNDCDITCPNCGLHYEYTHTNSIDLRLKKKKKYNLEFELGNTLMDNDVPIEPLTTNTNTEVDFSNNITVPKHLTKELMSYFPKAKSPNSLMLDLGCGNAIHKNVCEHAGFEWVGLDYNSKEAPVLGDAHALPFKDNSFEFILSIAVLEHIRFPLIMMREAYRVLKPYGIFIGTVAFLEPFHSDSFYHHTHLGTFNSLHYAGFNIIKLTPNENTVLLAQASSGLFPKMPRFISRSIVYPIHLLHMLWWQARYTKNHQLDKYTRIKNTTGAFTFICNKI